MKFQPGDKVRHKDGVVVLTVAKPAKTDKLDMTRCVYRRYGEAEYALYNTSDLVLVEEAAKVS